MNAFKYIDSSYIKKIQDIFVKHFSKESLDLGEVDRDQLFDFAKSKEFKTFFYSLSKAIVEDLSLDENEVLLQPNVTMRQFNANSHGTSFHTDYLYGHGEKTYTVWVPLYGLIKGNSFWMLENNDGYNLEVLALNYTKELEEKLIKNSFEVLPSQNQCIAFRSKTIHGSPLNNSLKTRYSFDFRISLANEKSSTKKINEYLILQNNKWVTQPNQFKELFFLKYICGGLDKDTAMQHEIIEHASRKKKIKIIAQEAELERFGFKVFERHLNEKNNKGFNAIIIASKNIIDYNCLELIKKSHLKVYSALESIFLN